jgi:hypothetical protein
MGSNTLVLYLDTNHLSRLGKHPSAPDSTGLVQVLEETGAALALSLVHLIELADPDFISGPRVAARLDTLPVIWALSPDDLWEAEVRSAFAAYAGATASVRPFGFDVSVALGGPTSGASPSEVLDAFRDPAIRHEIDQVAVGGLIFDRLKTDATLVQAPLRLLKEMIRKRQPQATEVGLVLPAPADPDDIIAAAGGLRGFPSYGLLHAVATARLRDKQFQADRSDVFDLMHAAYAVYADVTALDRSYAARVRAARNDLSKRVTHRLEEVPAMV